MQSTSLHLLEQDLVTSCLIICVWHRLVDDVVGLHIVDRIVAFCLANFTAALRII
jgi:hypothetical protein